METEQIGPVNAKEFFRLDRFATDAGIELTEIRKGYGKAKLEVEPRHLNAGGTTQGGAIFTLADLALAAAANSHGKLALSITSSITFLQGSAPGDTLWAEAKERHTGRKTGHYQVDVTNQKGDLIATFEATVYRKEKELPFNL